MNTPTKGVPARYCKKCGYIGPREYHNRPDTDLSCGWTAGVEPTQSSDEREQALEGLSQTSAELGGYEPRSDERTDKSEFPRTTALRKHKHGLRLSAWMDLADELEGELNEATEQLAVLRARISKYDAVLLMTLGLDDAAALSTLKAQWRKRR